MYEESAYKEPWRYRVGTSLAQQYGYIAERLFVSDEEAANSPSQIGVGGTDEVEPARGGDIKYLDVNNDGVIDEKDMVPIGNPTTPEIVYGFGVSAGYKNFDFSIFFQGSANTSFWIDAGATAPFQNNTQLLKVYADSHWAEDNQDVYAVWPRLSRTKNVNNTVKSTWFMRDGAFMRLKQLEVGYSLPQKALNKMYLSNLRFYVSGSNLLNFSKFKLWDVEMGGNGLGYPLQRVFNIGFNLSFN